MKKMKKIIGATLVAVIIANSSIPLAIAAESDAVLYCVKLTPKHQESLNGGEGFNTYLDIFEKMQTEYHDYVGCLFDFAENIILGNENAEFGGVFDANSNRSNLIDWMAPKQACIEDPTERKKIMNSSSPTALLGPILQAHSDYSTYLDKLAARYTSGEIKYKKLKKKEEAGLTGINALLRGSENLAQIQRKAKMEINSSMVAIDLMFTSLKELRFAFIMHVHLQCTLKFLEKYRRALEDLRKRIQPLPNKLRDASVSK